MFPAFCCLIWFWEGFSGCVLPGRKFHWDLDRSGHSQFQLKSVYSYWRLTLRNGNGMVVEELNWIYMKKKCKMLHQTVLFLLKMVLENVKRPQEIFFSKAGDDIMVLYLEKSMERWRSVDSLCASLIVMTYGFPGTTYWGWVWDQTKSWGKEIWWEDLCDSWRWDIGEEGRLMLVVYCRLGDNSVGFILKELREGWR